MPEITNPQEPTETVTPEGDLLIEGAPGPGGDGSSLVLQGGKGGAGGQPGKPGEPGEPGEIRFAETPPHFPAEWDRVPPKGGDVNLHVGKGHDGERDGIITLTARGGFLRRLWFLLIAPFTYLFVGRIRL